MLVPGDADHIKPKDSPKIIIILSSLIIISRFSLTRQPFSPHPAYEKHGGMMIHV